MTQFLRKYRVLFLIISIIFIYNACKPSTRNTHPALVKISTGRPVDNWKPPIFNFDTLTTDEGLKKIIYGHDLISHTAKYFGPAGSISKNSNGMNCQNCHLESGTKPWGNSYAAVGASYPKFRARSGTVESIPIRVNDCFERSLNGKPIDTSGYEMTSIVSFIQWVGQNVKKDALPKGTAITELPYLDRAASAATGKKIYIQNCLSCHGKDGQGIKSPNGVEYTYPPLWGAHSYNNGAGMFRISRLAGFVKDNMPFGQAKHQNPVLTTEEAWDVSAYVNSQPRPNANTAKDWPNITAKPIDNPLGPYSDSFKESQHKYGPFKPIAAKIKEKA
jgi:thiosulfate dehydrogenase